MKNKLEKMFVDELKKREDKKAWYCSVCGFYHNLDSVCPKTGQCYEVVKMQMPVGVKKEETFKLVTKVEKKGKKHD